MLFLLSSLEQRKRLLELRIARIEQFGSFVHERLGFAFHAGGSLPHLLGMALVVAHHIGKKRLAPIGSGAFCVVVMMVMVLVVMVMAMSMFVVVRMLMHIIGLQLPMLFHLQENLPFAADSSPSAGLENHTPT